MHLSAKECESYYCNQVGGGGHGYYHSNPIQRGYGFFGDLRRFITPLAFRAGRYLGRQLLHTGKNVISDVGAGSSFRDSARNRIREASQKIKKDFFQKLQQGKGIKRKRAGKSRQTKTKRCKTTRRDIFS